MRGMQLPRKTGRFESGGEEGGAESARSGRRSSGARANWRCRAVPSLQTRHSNRSRRVWTFSVAPGQKAPVTGVTKRDVDARAPFSHACSTLTPAAFLSSVCVLHITEM